MSDEQQSTDPPEDLPADYEPPAVEDVTTVGGVTEAVQGLVSNNNN
jgi:hypothetical protein